MHLLKGHKVATVFISVLVIIILYMVYVWLKPPTPLTREDVRIEIGQAIAIEWSKQGQWGTCITFTDGRMIELPGHIWVTTDFPLAYIWGVNDFVGILPIVPDNHIVVIGYEFRARAMGAYSEYQYIAGEDAGSVSYLGIFLSNSQVVFHLVNSLAYPETPRYLEKSLQTIIGETIQIPPEGDGELYKYHPYIYNELIKIEQVKEAK